MRWNSFQLIEKVQPDQNGIFSAIQCKNFYWFGRNYVSSEMHESSRLHKPCTIE